MTSPTTTSRDVINELLGATGTGPITNLRDQKPQLAPELQAYYESLFSPSLVSAEAFPLADRALVAIRVASHTRSAAVIDWYANLARNAGVAEATIDQVRRIENEWMENTKLSAAMRHADLLTTAPADANPSHLQALKDAGFTPAGILSLSQTIAFVSYQLRLIAGLRAFGEQS